MPDENNPAERFAAELDALRAELERQRIDLQSVLDVTNRVIAEVQRRIEEMTARRPPPQSRP